MNHAVDAWPIILKTIAIPFVAFVAGVFLVIVFEGSTARAGFVLAIDGAVWAGIQAFVFVNLRSEADHTLAHAEIFGGPIQAIILDQARSELSWIYGWLFKTVNTIFASVAVGALTISLVVRLPELEADIKGFAQDRFLFTSMVILPFSLIVTYMGMMLTNTRKDLPNFATVFAAIFGTLVALYAMSDLGQ